MSSLYVFKSLLETERYLSLDLLSKQRYSLSKPRCASHTLHVEAGRHTVVEKNPKESLHIVFYIIIFVLLIVNSTEYHAFFHCTKYSDIREIYLFSWYGRSRDLISYCSLMSSRQGNIIKNIALYVCKLVDRFEQRHKYSHVMTQLIL